MKTRAIKLRSWARWPVRGLRVPIQSGPCRGMWWSLATRTRFLRGVYEPEQAELTSRLLGSGDVFWDIGAHFGYYTLLASRAVAPANGDGQPDDSDDACGYRYSCFEQA